MSYYGNPPTLIARRGYSGALGDASACGPDQQWDPNFVFNGIKGQCTPKGSPMAAADSGGGILSKIGDFFSGAVKGALNLYGSTKVAEGQSQAYQQMLAQQQAMPGWVIPVAIGGVGLVAVLLLRGGGGGGGPRQNPARGRRRKRRASSRRRRTFRRRAHRRRR